MKTDKPDKKKPEEIQRNPLKELEMGVEDWEEFAHGVRLFNEGKFWHSHEAWEQVWRRHSEDERLFFQGLIQLAAAYHHLTTKANYRGVMNNFEKAYAKLEVFQPEYLGVLVKPLLRFIEEGRREADRLGADALEEFNFNLIPKLQFHKPNNPDLLIEIRDIIRSEEFLEGVKLFNTGYHWEAHETWEDVWRDLEGDAKTFVQSFVQMAAGYSFLKLCKFSSAKYLFEKSIEKFRGFEKLDFGMPIDRNIPAMEEALDAIQRHLTNGHQTIKLSKLPVLSPPSN